MAVYPTRRFRFIVVDHACQSIRSRRRNRRQIQRMRQESMADRRDRAGAECSRAHVQAQKSLQAASVRKQRLPIARREWRQRAGRISWRATDTPVLVERHRLTVSARLDRRSRLSFPTSLAQETLDHARLYIASRSSFTGKACVASVTPWVYVYTAAWKIECNADWMRARITM